MTHGHASRRKHKPKRVPVPSLPTRPEDSHKGRFGHVLVVAGSQGMTGAGALCVLAALRSGAGLASVAAPEPLLRFILPLVPEATWLPLPSSREHLTPDDVPAILQHLHHKSSVLAAGPGLGRSEETLQAVEAVLSETPRPAVVDADALFAFKEAPEKLRSVPAPCIITPHPGEMAALLGMDVSSIQKAREETAVEAARTTGKVVVLKGAGTVVSDGNRIYVNRTGGPALAKGGSGDVLTGVAAAFLAQGMAPFEAAVLAVHLHGLAGDLAAETFAPHCVLARDVIDLLPEAFLQHEGLA